MRNSFVPILFALFLLTACAPQMPTAQAEAAPTATPTATATATATPTFTPTVTLTPTATATPTATVTPTPTPITLPVTNGTPIPDLPYEVITAENVSRLRQIARYGYARLLDENPYRLTADGRTIAVGTTAGVEFYDAQTQEKTGTLAVDFLSAFDITPDGKYLLTSAGETLTVWTRDTQKVREFDLEIGDAWDLNAVALSPDGALLAVQRPRGQVVEQEKIDVYRVSDGSLLDTVRGMGAVFSPDGQYLAAVFDGSVRLYPVAELGEGWEKRLPKQTLPWCGINETCGLTFSPDGTLAAVVRSSRVDVYQVAERKLVRQVSGWEADRYRMPTVQFADGQVLITTPPIYDGQGEVKVTPKAIAVDMASGEWVSKVDDVDGFAYLDNEQVRVFRWMAEGEMPPAGVEWLHPTILVQDNGNVRLYVTDWWNLGWKRGALSYNCENEKCDVIYGDWKKVIFYDDKKTEYEFYRKGGKGYVLAGNNTFEVPVSDWIFGYVINSRYLLWSVSYSQTYGQSVIYDMQDGKVVLKTSYIHPDNFYTVGDLVFYSDLSGSEFAVLDLKGQGILSTVEQKQIPSINEYPRIQSFPFVSNKGLLLRPFFDGEIETICLVSAGECSPIFFIEVMTANLSPSGRFLATYGSDGFIRVWAVVPEDAPVK